MEHLGIPIIMKSGIVPHTGLLLRFIIKETHGKIVISPGKMVI